MCGGRYITCVRIADTTATRALDPAVKAETLTAPCTHWCDSWLEGTTSGYRGSLLAVYRLFFFCFFLRSDSWHCGVQITDTPLTPEMTPALEALICSELHHPNILATLRYACRPHKVPLSHASWLFVPLQLPVQMFAMTGTIQIFSMSSTYCVSIFVPDVPYVYIPNNSFYHQVAVVTHSIKLVPVIYTITVVPE